ncbi:MAG: putative outer membrane usher protein ElfC [Candidatus Erwinia impunctatus]
MNPHDLTVGNTVAFLNYISNYYHVSYSGDNPHDQDSLWLSLNGGANIVSWQFRQISNLNWNQQTGTNWNRIRSYVQRPIPGIGSQFSAGGLITNGRFFSGMNYNGVNLYSDDRMLPDSMRGYAPVIRGIASTNAKVTVSQNGAQIYQVTVVPGPFEINDLYPTSYSGDLDVEVSGADGTVSRFSVPFSAVPESIRPGTSRYNFALGKTRDSGSNSDFTDFTWQKGISNAVTGNMGARIAQGYQSLMAGSVYNSHWGAVGLDVNYSRAELPDSGYLNGWMARVSYSKTFQPSNTSVSLGAYCYSSAGYRELTDVLGVREAEKSGGSWSSNTYQQESRVDLPLSQNLGEYGSVFVSAASQTYRNQQARDTQLQLGYGGSFSNGISYNLSVGRQQIASYSHDASKETVTSLSVSIPLNVMNKSIAWNNSYTRSSDGGGQYQTSLSGTVDKDNTLNYNLAWQRDQQYNNSVISGNLQKRFPDVSVGLNASQGKNYWQGSGYMQGALALHSGGITFGPYLGETFALVEAKGAIGAKVYNSQQSTIDRWGYAFVPSLPPYRYSRITLDPQGMDSQAELIDNEKRVAPVAGASVKVSFKTRTGTPLLIASQRPSGAIVPLGAEVYDDTGNSIGMVGQEGQVYMRSEQRKGSVTIKWGTRAEEQCRLPYDFTETKPGVPLVRLSAICR